MSPGGDLRSRLAANASVRALRHHFFRIFLLAHSLSALGMWAQRVGVQWLTWELTHSGTWLGIIAASEFLPTFVITPFAGAISDRIDRRLMFFYIQFVMLGLTALLATLTIAGVVTAHALVAIVVALGIANAFAAPARMTITPGLVPRDDLPAAIGLNAVLFHLTTTIGPAIGGVIIASFGVGYAFVFNGLTYLWLAQVLFVIRLIHDEPSTAVRAGLFKEIGDGVHYLVNHQSIGPFILLILASATFTRPYQDLMSGFADGIFKRGPEGLSTLLSAAGVGGMIGAIYVTQFGRIHNLTAIVLTTMAVMAAALFAFANAPYFWLAAFFVVIVGATLTITSTGAQVLIQYCVETAMRGRVMSIYGLTWRGAPALGALVMGSLSSWVGFQVPLAGGAVLCLCAWAVIMPRRRVIAETFVVPASSSSPAAEAASPPGQAG